MKSSAGPGEKTWPSRFSYIAREHGGALWRQQTRVTFNHCGECRMNFHSIWSNYVSYTIHNQLFNQGLVSDCCISACRTFASTNDTTGTINPSWPPKIVRDTIISHTKFIFKLLITSDRTTTMMSTLAVLTYAYRSSCPRKQKKRTRLGEVLVHESRKAFPNGNNLHQCNCNPWSK